MDKERTETNKEPDKMPIWLKILLLIVGVIILVAKCIGDEIEQDPEGFALFLVVIVIVLLVIVYYLAKQK
jgi:uncharacterized membrane-anchored protein